ncbi:MAG: DUF6882 domain-containing protein [Betaproteobacteria bacterium]
MLPIGNIFRLAAPLLLALAATAACAQSPRDFIDRSVTDMRAKTDAHAKQWRLGRESGWNVDQDKGELELAFADGTVRRMPVQIIGTYNRQEQVFQWAWGHASVVAGMRRHAEAAREWGVRNKQAKYASRVIPATQEEAFQFTAVAATLSAAKGIYRGQAGTAWVYMTFGEPKPGN